MKIDKKTLTLIIAEAVSARVQATVDKKNEKLKSDFKKKVTNEVDDSMNRDRIEGLVNEQDFVEFTRSVTQIGEDLALEGFSVSDIEEFLIDHVRHTLASLHGVYERKLTKKEKTGLKKLHKDVPKKPFTKKYGKEEGEKIYHATTTKMAKKKY